MGILRVWVSNTQMQQLFEKVTYALVLICVSLLWASIVGIFVDLCGSLAHMCLHLRLRVVQCS